MSMDNFFAGVATAVLLLLKCMTQIACHRKGERFLYPSRVAQWGQKVFLSQVQNALADFSQLQRNRPGGPHRRKHQIAAAIAFPTSSVPALPPMSRVRGPSMSTVSMAFTTAFAASGWPRCSSIIAPDQT